MRIPILDLQPAVAELRPELDAAYHRVMDSGWFLLGRELETFEREYAAAVGTKHCIGVANGLEALQLILLARGIGPGDEVIVPSNGYIATWLAVTQAGARPVPCEPDPRTFNLDPARLAAVVSERTKAILPIHLYGQTADMQRLNTFARDHGLYVIEDAAQAHGARCKLSGSAILSVHQPAADRPGAGDASAGTTSPFALWSHAGALGHAAGISFYPSKNLGALGDAGAVTTDDDTLADAIRIRRNYGARVRYQNEEIGMNSRLSELQAAFLRVKLAHLPGWNRRRIALAGRYSQELQGVGDLVLPQVPDWADPVWHLYVVRTRHRDALQAHLQRATIGTQIHYPTPPHLSGAYRSAGWKRGDFPVAEQLADEVLSLPIGPHHSVEQIDEVCAEIRRFFDRQ